MLAECPLPIKRGREYEVCVQTGYSGGALDSALDSALGGALYPSALCAWVDDAEFRVF